MSERGKFVDRDLQSSRRIDYRDAVVIGDRVARQSMQDGKSKGDLFQRSRRHRSGQYGIELID